LSIVRPLEPWGSPGLGANVRTGFGPGKLRWQAVLVFHFCTGCTQNIFTSFFPSFLKSTTVKKRRRKVT